MTRDREMTETLAVVIASASLGWVLGRWVGCWVDAGGRLTSGWPLGNAWDGHTGTPTGAWPHCATARQSPPPLGARPAKHWPRPDVIRPQSLLCAEVARLARPNRVVRADRVEYVARDRRPWTLDAGRWTRTPARDVKRAMHEARGGMGSQTRRPDADQSRAQAPCASVVRGDCFLVVRSSYGRCLWLRQCRCKAAREAWRH